MSMQNREDLSRLGVFSLENFFDDRLCSAVINEVRSANKIMATVTAEGDYLLDEDYRRVKRAEVSPDAAELVRSRLIEIKPKVEEVFDLSLSGVQDPHFLIYEEGDFFQLHMDGAEDEFEPLAVKQRQVSAVIFLNDAAEEPSPGVYGGGKLIFHDGPDTPGGAERQIQFDSKKGMLITFRSHLPHEVTAVTHGQRYTIITWFF